MHLRYKRNMGWRVFKEPKNRALFHAGHVHDLLNEVLTGITTSRFAGFFLLKMS